MIGGRRLLEAWEPPEQAGDPLGCIATSFTFNPDFFEIQCLGRFLMLDWQREEGEPLDKLASVIEQHARFADTPVTVVVDRTDDPGKRSLLWDLLRVRVRGGLMHAKVSLLVWDGFVRVIIGSANLTPAGYREQVEAEVILDAHPESRAPRPVVLAALASLRALIDHTAPDAGDDGPHRRALATMDLARRLVDGFGLPAEGARREPRLAVGHSEAGRSALTLLNDVWRGGPARWATVLSPFHDAPGAANSAPAALAAHLARRGPAEIWFVLPTDTRQAATVVRAPRELASGAPGRVKIHLNALAVDADEPRRLHAKVIVLESESWVAAMIGSSNFTRAGLGLQRGAGHLEVNIAVGAPAGSRSAKAILALIPFGDEIAPHEVEWEPEEDDEEAYDDRLPDGFAQATYVTGDDPALRLEFDPEHGLPSEWRVRDPTERDVLDSIAWSGLGSPRAHDIPWPMQPPVFLTVGWSDADATHTAAWPVNADKPSQLPLPPELKLSLRELIDVLRSSRSMADAIAHIRSRDPGDAAYDTNDPLQRHAGTGQLLRRTRETSAAFEGMRRFLERPAATVEVLRWRLSGPFGPRRFAAGLSSAISSQDSLNGEAPFMMAELALTVSRVDWSIVCGSGLPPKLVRAEVRHLISDLRAMTEQPDRPSPLSDYIADAFAEAAR